MKVSIIGGGSTYTPELVSGFIKQIDSFPVNELWLMDIDPERLNIVGEFAKRMVAAKGDRIKIVISANQQEAVADSAYIITQLRVGRMMARREDEYLGLRHHLIGQETTGVGGMAKALRTIPVILDIADDIRKYSPNALLANFTNPSGLITQALAKHAPDITAVGVCNAPFTTKMSILSLVEKHTGMKFGAHIAELNTLGLNHLSWHRGFTIEHQDFWPQILEWFIEELKFEDEPMWDPHLIEVLRMIPNYYLDYFYNAGRNLEKQKMWPPSRADEVIQVEKDLLVQYAEPSLNEPPSDLMKRGGAYYSTVATQILNAHYNDLGEVHVVNTLNNGAVQEWSKDWVLEMPCKVDRRGIHPLQTEPLPAFCFGLIAAVKSYELLTIEAAVNGDRNAAYKALLAHPLGPDSDSIQAVLDDLLLTNRVYLPRFWN